MTGNFRIEPFVSETGEKLIKVYPKSNNEGLPVEIDSKARFCILNERSLTYLESFHNFEVRKDDIWVITSPKSGTTWMLELCWLLMHDFDYETAMKVDHNDRSQFFEYCTLYPKEDSIELAKNMPSPRLLKSHLPMHLLPKSLWTVKPKIIYVTREIKDVIVSYYHHKHLFGLSSLNKADFLDSFLKHNVTYTPYWSHVIEFWQIRNKPNVCITSYEQMKNDLRSVILRISEFLQKPVKEKDMKGMLDYLSFDKMKTNKSLQLTKWKKEIPTFSYFQGKEFDNSNHSFIRKGVIGSHKEEFNDDTIKRIDEWTKNSLKPYGVTLEELL